MIGTIAHIGRGFGPLEITGGVGAPESPVISVKSAGANLVLDITSAVGVKVLCKLKTAANWTLAGTRYGTGELVISGLIPGDYDVLAYSYEGESYSLPSNLLSVYMRDTGEDPFTTVYNRLWDLLENNGELASLVKIGNRIKSTKDAAKKTYSNADLPELRIEPSGGKCEIKKTNTTMPITQNFSVVCTTGDLRVHKSFLPVKWALLNALTDTIGNLGLSFVRHIALTDVVDGANSERFPGWNTAFEISVEMWFKII